MTTSIPKQIFIVNGKPGVGKDTFEAIVAEKIPAAKYSAISYVKIIARECGWYGSKDSRDRDFLSRLKDLINGYSDIVTESLVAATNRFFQDDTLSVLFLDMREPLDIERYVNLYKGYTKTVLIRRPEVEQQEYGNHADAEVDRYRYDFTLLNDGSFGDFRDLVEQWADENVRGFAEKDSPFTYSIHNWENDISFNTIRKRGF